MGHLSRDNIGLSWYQLQGSLRPVFGNVRLGWREFVGDWDAVGLGVFGGEAGWGGWFVVGMIVWL